MLLEMLTLQDMRVLHAALCDMIVDDQSPQENLSEEDWLHAGALFSALNAELMRRRGEKSETGLTP